MKADPKIETEVMSVLRKISDSYEQRDINALAALFIPDPDAVMIGTGADEKRVGLAEIKAQAKRDWGQSDSATIKFSDPLVSMAGAVAWVMADATFNVKAGGEELTLGGRMTGVLEKRGDKWLIAQAHFSMPLPGQAEGESFPA